MVRLNTMSSVRNVFIPANRAFGYQSCIAESFKEPNSEGVSSEMVVRLFLWVYLPLVPLNIITMEDELAILQEEFNEFAANSGSRVVGVSYTRKWKNR